jgi:hypothetical protein
MKSLLACCSLLVVLTACVSDPTRSGDAISLFYGKDLSQWRNPNGWQVARSVSLKRDDAHLFGIEPGT